MSSRSSLPRPYSASLWSGARRYVLLRRMYTSRLPPEDATTPISPARASGMVTGWYGDDANRSRLRSFAAHPEGLEIRDVYRHSDDALKTMFRRELERGTLALFELPSRVGSASPMPKETVKDSAAAADETTTWFELTVIDEYGDPVNDIDFELTIDGAARKMRTPASGKLRVDDATGSFGSARLVNVAATREALKPRWATPRARSVPDGPNVDILPLSSDSSRTVSLEAKKPKTVVVVRPLARARLIGMYFETNKCLLLPSAMHGIRGLVEFYKRKLADKLLVVGHTDTAGDDDYNLTLSLERAEAFAAYLRNDVGAWEAWFQSSKAPEKRWGTRECQHMLHALPEGGPKPFYPDKPNGADDPQTRESVLSFQAWSNETRGTGLVVDGIIGPATRHEIIRAYMELEGTTLPTSVELVTHGCGEFFPEKPTEDGVREDDNRRVEVFGFEGSIMPPPPGKTSKRGSPEYPIWRNQVTETIDFTHAGLTVKVLDQALAPAPHANVRITGPKSDEGTTGPDGIVVFMNLPDGSYVIHVERDGWPEEDRTFELPAPATSTGGETLGVVKEGDAPSDAPKTTTEKPEVVVVLLPNYWEYPALDITPGTTKNDPAVGTSTFKKFARQIKNDLRAARFLAKSAADDETLGYDVQLAIKRFKRAAHRIFRVHMNETPGDIIRPAGIGPDVSAADVFALPIVKGHPSVDTQMKADFAKELHTRWLIEGWVRPVGRFQVKTLTRSLATLNAVEVATSGRPPPYCDPKDLRFGLRADVAKDWEAVCAKVEAAGGALHGPYGDSGVRQIGTKKQGGGSSPRSRHFFGLAIDFNQHFAQPGWVDSCVANGCLIGRKSGGKPVTTLADAKKLLKHQRYYRQAVDANGIALASADDIGKGMPGTKTFWVIWCWVDEAVPGLSRHLDASSTEKWVTHWDVSGGGPPPWPFKFALNPFPSGEYVNLSDLIESTGRFSRIPIADGFENFFLPEESRPKGFMPEGYLEWWHWGSCIDEEVPFSKRKPFEYSSTAKVVDMADLVGYSETDLKAKGLSDTDLEWTTA